MGSIEVKKARTEDVTAICSIQTERELSPWPRAAYELEIERSDSITLVAYLRDGRSAEGFIAGRVIAGGPGSAYDAEIYNIGVRKAVESRGVGSALLNEFVRICSDLRVSRIFLEVRQANLSAIGFYRSHGFVKIGERKGFYADPVENAEIMAMNIKESKAL